MKFLHWDKAGLKLPPIGERADCVVRAIAYLCEMDYCDAQTFLSGRGRDRGRGVSTARVIEECGNVINQHTFTKLPRNHFTLGAFVKHHPTGSYLLRISGHVFPLVDGTVVDYCHRPSNTVLDWAMEVTTEIKTLTLEDIL